MKFQDSCFNGIKVTADTKSVTHNSCAKTVGGKVILFFKNHTWSEAAAT